MALADSQQKPWHHRPAIIIALLVIFPPAGIALMWMRLPWAKQTKVIVTVLAGAWLLVAFGLKNRADKEKARSTAAAKATPATKEPATTPGQAATTPTPATPAPPTGPALIEKEPLLVIPTKLDGFALAQALQLPPNVTVGARASYYGDNKHLVAHVATNKGEVTRDAPNDKEKAFKVADHDGRIAEDKSGKTITIAWNASGWNALVTVDYERASDRGAAEKAVQAIAPQVSAVLEQYLTGTPPNEATRQQQLAEITKATSTSKVQDFMSKLETAGIANDLVSSAGFKGLPDELIITVGSTWHRAIRQERLIAAKNLWKLWSEINSPNDRDKSRIKLVDVNGNEVGGSGVMGSSIKVDK
jgi:hypothetical protein